MTMMKMMTIMKMMVKTTTLTTTLEVGQQRRGRPAMFKRQAVNVQ
jgi:hypothetical protein